MPRLILLAIAGVALSASAALAGGPPSPPVAVPPASDLVADEANMAMKKALDRRHEELAGRLRAWSARAEAFNKAYSGRTIVEGSKEARDGAAEQSWLTAERAAYTKAAEAFAADVGKLRLTKERTDRLRRIALMNAMARRLKWGEKEQERLSSALNSLALDGDQDATLGDVVDAWKAIRARGQDADLAREASTGRGPELPGAGNQSFNDCTIYALANASGVPYEVVAARATGLIEDGEWRSPGEREQAQRVIENHGLNGDEVIMLAESLGQADVVRSNDFPKVLQGGRPILACVMVGGDAQRPYFHQVVITRSFQHAGGTWFEMQDSNLGPGERRFLSERELQVVLVENGVAYRREPKTTPKLLRPQESK